MRILSFEFHDADGWTLEPMKLDAFNLLVGLSGAGKTRIVRAIERVCDVALGKDAESARWARFAIDFEHLGLVYRWEAELSPSHPEDDVPLIRLERITQGEHTLVERSTEQFAFKGQTIPLLDRSSSAIVLLKEDSAIAPLHVAFSRCVFRALTVMLNRHRLSKSYAEKKRDQLGSLEALGADFSLRLHHKAALLVELFPDAFGEIEAAFREAFPLVRKLMVLRTRMSDVGVPGAEPERHEMYLAVAEDGVERAVPFSAMSSGMQRYLSFLVHLSFAPRGTVVLIDELESSFGINCLPAATRFLLRRAPDLQFILTSHHPYIIEKIPTDLWKIVTRKGSHVRVLDAAAIPALEESRSHLDRFTRLINLPEYEQGIQA